MNYFIDADGTRKVLGLNYTDGNGTKTGWWINWWPNGNIAAKVSYSLSGDPIGQWIYWREDGSQYRTESYYKDGVPHDISLWIPVTMMMNQATANAVINVTDKQGLRQGMWEYTSGWEHDEIHRGLYVDGKKSGEWTVQFRKRTKKTAPNVTDKEGRRQGKWVYISDWSLGRNKSGMYIDGKKTGEWIDRYHDGQIAATHNYVDGLRSGDYAEWYTNGQMMNQGTYDAGHYTGDSKSWEENGQLSDKGSYDDKTGLPTGLWENWTWEGNNIHSGHYNGATGRKTGEWTYWNGCGCKQEQGHYNAETGKHSGVWFIWDSDGKREHKIEYDTSGEPSEYIPWKEEEEDAEQ